KITVMMEDLRGGLWYHLRITASRAQTERPSGAGPVGGSLGGKDPTGRFSFHGPVVEMAPSKEPMVRRVAVSNSRSVVKPPVAPVKRPVPPVMIAVSTISLMPGVAVGVLMPVNTPVSASPLAATN